MESKTIYIAFDGKEFNDKDECLEYERRKKYLKPFAKAHFYNFKGQEISVNDAINDIDMVFIVFLPTIEAVKSFRELNYQLTLSESNDITEPGIYFFEEAGEKDWHEIEDFPCELANTYDRYKTAKQIKEQLENEN